MYTAKLTYKMDETNTATIEFAIQDYYVNINSLGSSCRFYLTGAMNAKLEELVASYVELTFMEIFNANNELTYSSGYWRCITGLNSSNERDAHELYFAHEDNRFIEAE